ncbi:MAG: hypothetical protein HY537_18270, partial [Deltaproteobacteria bacterium]|nr:hypothetical protein [Deltaproteobacteria bacterium]
MIKMIVSLVGMFALVFLQACSKPSDSPASQSGPDGEKKGAPEATSIGNGGYLKMTADLSDAKSLTTTAVKDPTKENKTLFKITSSNAIKEVFSGPNSVYFWKETPSYIIAQVKIEEEGKACFLIAIPKLREKTKVLCLSRNHLEIGLTRWYNPFEFEIPNRAQFDVRGEEVYFTNYYVKSDKPNDYYSGDHLATELRYWDGKADKASTLFYKEHSKKENKEEINQVFLSLTNAISCFNFYGSGSGIDGVSGQVFCRLSNSDLWKQLVSN